jgi:hypothetical protein
MFIGSINFQPNIGKFFYLSSDFLPGIEPGISGVRRGEKKSRGWKKGKDKDKSWTMTALNRKTKV